jgi:hypothetical protein
MLAAFTNGYAIFANEKSLGITVGGTVAFYVV